jgi:hypothetical protein
MKMWTYTEVHNTSAEFCQIIIFRLGAFYQKIYYLAADKPE